MNKTPLYFNYVGSQRDLLDRAIESYDRLAGDILDIRVHYSHKPRKFSTCLNEILRLNDQPYLFSHFDTVLQSRSAVENILSFRRDADCAIVGHCALVDLLMLVVPDMVRTVGGWDESFSNSWMDLDLYNRLGPAGLKIDVIHRDVVDGRGIAHLDASSSRKDPTIKKVYTKTMREDLETYYSRYGSKTDSEYIRLRSYISAEFGEYSGK